MAEHETPLMPESLRQALALRMAHALEDAALQYLRVVHPEHERCGGCVRTNMLDVTMGRIVLEGASVYRCARNAAHRGPHGKVRK